MSLQEFKEQVRRHGLAKTNHFFIQFNAPNLIQKDMFDLRAVLLLCESATLPSLNIATQPVRTFGEQREMPYEVNYEPITMSFYTDRKMVIRDFFDTWISNIFNPETRITNYYSDYTTNITVTVVDSEDKSMYQVELFEAYPKTVQSIVLDQNSREVLKTTVTFTYRYHVHSRMDALSGQPELNNIFNQIKEEGLNGMIPFDYSNAGGLIASNMPEEFTNSFISLQERYIDSIAVRNAVREMASQGLQTAIGGDFGII